MTPSPSAPTALQSGTCETAGSSGTEGMIKPKDYEVPGSERSVGTDNGSRQQKEHCLFSPSTEDAQSGFFWRSPLGVVEIYSTVNSLRHYHFGAGHGYGTDTALGTAGVSFSPRPGCFRDTWLSHCSVLICSLYLGSPDSQTPGWYWWLYLKFLLLRHCFTVTWKRRILIKILSSSLKYLSEALHSIPIEALFHRSLRKLISVMRDVHNHHLAGTNTHGFLHPCNIHQPLSHTGSRDT